MNVECRKIHSEEKENDKNKSEMAKKQYCSSGIFFHRKYRQFSTESYFVELFIALSSSKVLFLCGALWFSYRISLLYSGEFFFFSFRLSREAKLILQRFTFEQDNTACKNVFNRTTNNDMNS